MKIQLTVDQANALRFLLNTYPPKVVFAGISVASVTLEDNIEVFWTKDEIGEPVQHFFTTGSVLTLVTPPLDARALLVLVNLLIKELGQ